MRQPCFLLLGLCCTAALAAPLPDGLPQPGRPGAVVRLLPAIYRLHGQVIPAPGTTWMLEGADVTGGVLAGCTDGAIIAGNAALAYCRTLANGDTETLLHVSALVHGQPRTPGVNTEKAAVYARVQNDDASAYGSGGYEHDAVGIESQAIMGVSGDGRVWSYDAVVLVPPGKDGQGTGFEVDIRNSGVPGTLDRPDMKLGYDAACTGPNDCTAGFVLTSANGARFKDGLVVRSTSVAPGGDAISVRPTGDDDRDIAAIHADGSALFTAQTVAGHVLNTGAAPSLGGCGGAAVLTAGSSDRRGSVVVGAGDPASCTLAWQRPYPGGRPPFCVVGTDRAGVAAGAVPDSAGLAIALPTAATGATITWICEG